MTIYLEEEVERHNNEVACPCGGYAKRVTSTTEEIKDRSLNCGRNYACCCRAFTCHVCGERIVARALAPEMD